MFKGITTLTLITALLMSGCTKYSTYTDGVAKNTKYVAKSRQVIAEKVMDKLLANFDAAYAKSAAKAAEAPLVKFEYTDTQGKHTNTVYHPPPDPAVQLYMAGAGRAAVIREAVPLVHALIDNMAQEIKGPVTPEDVLYRIAQDGAAMVTMGAMYGITKEAVKAVQGNITSNISNGGAVSTDGASGASEYKPTTDNSIKSESPAAP